MSCADLPITFINLDLIRRAVFAEDAITLFFSESDQVVVRGESVEALYRRLSERAVGMDGVLFPDLPHRESWTLNMGYRDVSV